MGFRAWASEKLLAGHGHAAGGLLLCAPGPDSSSAAILTGSDSGEPWGDAAAGPGTFCQRRGVEFAPAAATW